MQGDAWKRKPECIMIEYFTISVVEVQVSKRVTIFFLEF